MLWRPRLQEVATGRPFEGKSLVDVFEGTSVSFTGGWATGIFPAERMVQVEMEERTQHLPYDRLIYALGSRVDQETVPGVGEHAYVLNPDGQRAVHDLAEKLADLPDNRRVVVVGGGATGVEAAPQIKGVHPSLHVTLVSKDTIGGFKGDRVMHHIHNSMRRQQIEMREHTPIQRVHKDHLVKAKNQKLYYLITPMFG